MLVLSRTVRFCVNPGEGAGGGRAGPVLNGFGGHPSMRGLGRYYEVVVRCAGEADARTGYFLDIKVIDGAVRERLIPGIALACESRPESEPAEVLGPLMDGLDEALGGVVRSVEWRLTPFYSVEMFAKEGGMALLRQRFDLAAAHRLCVPGASEEENRRLFGKCANAAGHGHNYQVEPCVEVPVGAGAGRFGLSDLERLTVSEVVEPFDHKHLNLDTAEFAEGTGVNPSVENIARVFFERLAPAVAGTGTGARLRSVTVWETDKTSCTYPG